MTDPTSEIPARARLSIVAVASAYPSAHLPHHNPFVHVLMRGIADLGHDVRVVAPRRIPRLVLNPSRDTWDGIDVRRPRYVSPGVAWPWAHERLRLSHRLFTGAAARAAATLPTPEVVVGFFLRPAGAAAFALGQQWGRPAFAVIGEGDIPGHNRVADDAQNGALARRLTGLVVLSEAAKSELIARYRVDPARIAVIPIGVDPVRFSPGDRGEARRRLGLDPQRFVVVYVGRLEHSKGSDRLAEAVRELDGVTALFVGAGDRGGLGPNCTAVGPVPHDAVATYLRAADVFVLPSLVEGVSNAVVEAMSCGLPVIVSDRAFNRAVADERSAAFVDPLDPVHLRREILSLRGDPVRRAAMAAAAVERAGTAPAGRQAATYVRWFDEMRSGSSP